MGGGEVSTNLQPRLEVDPGLLIPPLERPGPLDPVLLNHIHPAKEVHGELVVGDVLVPTVGLGIAHDLAELADVLVHRAGAQRGG